MTTSSDNLENAIAEFREYCGIQLMLMSYGVYYFGIKTSSGHRIVLIADDGEIIGQLAPPNTESKTHHAWDWGNTSPAAAQLALALLSERIADPAAALACHLNFTSQIVAKLPHAQWLLNGIQIAEWFKNREVPKNPTPPRTESSTSP
jgi:hypothetical protein